MTAIAPLLPVELKAGSLESYIASVNRLPMLTADEELRLAKSYRDLEDLDAARALVMSHLRVVVSIARQYLGYGLPHADLIQEGNIGLMKAVKKYDPNQGVRLVTYAIHWIKAEIHEYILRNWRLVKVATTKAQRKLFFKLRSNRPTLNPLSQDEIQNLAKSLDVKVDDVKEMESRLTANDVAIEGSDSDDEHSFAPIQWLEDHRYEPTEVIAKQEYHHLQTAGVEEALTQLDPRSQRIIRSRWLDVNDEGKASATLHDLAAEFNISAERVRQLESLALKKMKSALQTYQ